MKLYFVLILIFLYVSSLFSSNCNFINFKKQEKLFNQLFELNFEKVDKSEVIEILNEINELCTLSDKFLYFEAIIYTKVNHFEKAHESLEKIRPYLNVLYDEPLQYTLLKDIQLSKDLNPLKCNTMKWNQTIDKLKNDADTFLLKNYDFIKKYESLYNADQQLRWANIYLFDYPELAKEVWEFTYKKIDSLNIYTLEKDIDTLGHFPKLSQASSFPFMIALHNHDKHDMYIKLIEEQCLIGESNWEDYEFMLGWIEYPLVNKEIKVKFENLLFENILEFEFLLFIERMSSTLAYNYIDQTLEISINISNVTQKQIEVLEKLILLEFKKNNVNSNRLSIKFEKSNQISNTVIYKII